MKHVLIFLSLLLVYTATLAQFKVGANIQTQYVFRGSQYCNTPTIGGNLEYVTGDFFINSGVTGGINGLFAENCNSIGIRKSVWSLSVTDYYYPYPDNHFGNFASGNRGAHYLEASGTYSYKGFGILLSSIVYNDTTGSHYLQFSYGHDFYDDTGRMECFIGFVGGKTHFYNTTVNKIQPIFVGVKYQKTRYSFTYFINPTADTNGIIVAYDL